MFERFSDNARQIIVRAQTEVRDRGHEAVTPEHLLLAIAGLTGSDAQRVLTGLGVSLQELEARIATLLPSGSGGPVAEHVPFSPEAKLVLEMALRAALQRNFTFIASRHVLLALLDTPGPAADLLSDLACSAHYIDSLPWSPERGDLPPYDALVEEHRELQRQVQQLSERVQALEERLR